MLIEAANRPSTSEAAWLAAVLGKGITPAFPGRNNAAFRSRLRQVSFEGLISAIGAVGPAAGRAGIIELYRHWIECQGPGAPHLFAAWFNLGVDLASTGDTRGAMLAYRNALIARPNFAAAAMNLATLLEADGRAGEAIPVLDGALQSDEVRTTLLNNRGRLLEQIKRLREAEQEFEASLLIQPSQSDVIQHWLHVRQKQCRWPVFSDAIPGLSQESQALYAGPLSGLALFDDVARQRAISEDWIRRKTVPAERLSPPSGYRHDRIRLGYMSSDFCRHAMSLLIAELFERHDRSRFELFGYCASPEDGSDIRARVIASFDHFTRIAQLSDEQAARAIRADEIDILIDLNGLTSGARMQVLRWRPAPVQATYLGFIGPVPLPELDYMFCDRFVVPPEIAPEYRPAPLYIAECYQANDSKRETPAPRPRAELGLPDDRFVFCCFSNHYKITEAMFGAWMDILRRVEDGILWLAADTAWSRDNLAEAARNAGVDPARIVFMARTGPTEYLANLGAADLFLDTFPYNAGTVASDAIRMHLPLLTLSGRSFASRMAGRLLAALGAEDGIATTMRDYVETAVALATDRSRYAAYKARFTDDAWAGTIGNITGFTEEYERSLMSIVVTPELHASDAAGPAGSVTGSPGMLAVTRNSAPGHARNRHRGTLQSGTFSEGFLGTRFIGLPQELHPGADVCCKT
jgi:predicted O-linked N-acetylglucosamine transferase (SPINDLY family)